MEAHKYNWDEEERLLKGVNACANYLHQCHYCAARKAHNLRARVPIMQYDKPVRPFYRMHMDLTVGERNTFWFSSVL